MRRTIFALAAASSLGACAPDEPAPSVEAPAARAGLAAGEDWSRYVDAFVTRYFESNPHQAVAAGLHEYDGRLPDLSPRAVAETTAWLHEQRERLAAWDLDNADETAR